MLVTTYGKGAIFATTMFLALGQPEPRLLDAFLRCSDHTEWLPQRPRPTQLLINYQNYGIVILAAALFLTWPLIFGGHAPPEWLRYTATVLLTLALALLRLSLDRLLRFTRDVLGR